MRYREIALDSVRLEVIETEGSRLQPPVFLFHGNSSAADAFENLMRTPLMRRWRMVAVSFPGHGGSSADMQARYSVRQLGEFAAKLVASYAEPNYFVVGHSLGGHALLETLELLPGAQGLALLSSPPLSMETLSEAFKPDPSGGALFKSDLSKAELDALASCFIDVRHVAQWNLVRRNIDRADPLFRPALGASLADGKLQDEVHAFFNSSVPIAMIAGKDDLFLRRHYAKQFEGMRLWKRRPHMLNDCGHCPHLEHPEKVSRILNAFFSECLLGRRARSKPVTGIKEPLLEQDVLEA